MNGHKDELPVSPTVLGDVLQPGHEVLIDDGRLRLLVERVESGRATCAVVVGGVVTSHKGVNVPGVPIPIPSLTRKDLDDLDFALEHLDVDYVALSFVRSAADVRDLQDLIEHAGSRARVIAKIEKAEAVDCLDEILGETDARHGRPRRPRGRDRRRRGAADPEADHRGGASSAGSR